MDPELVAQIRDLGLLGGTFVAIFALVRGLVVPRFVADEIRKDRDEWRKIALDAIGRVDALGDAVEDLVERLPPAGQR